MKISKRIVSMLVVMVLCIGIFPISTFAAGNIMHGIGFVKADSLRLRSKPVYCAVVNYCGSYCVYPFVLWKNVPR